MYRRPDGIVDFNKSICIGCKACIAACPYDAIFINPNDHSAEKCNFCAHRLDMNLEPACVVVCPTEAIIIGNMDDPSTKVAQIINRQPVSVRRPEKETHPKLFYKGAHQATLDPLAARRPGGGLYAWATQPQSAREIGSGHALGNSSAAALLSYDVSHKAPWDWRVSLYTWTKSLAAGIYLTAVLLAIFGGMPWTSPLMSWVVPIGSGAFLGITGLILIADLEHPERFYLIFTKHQWRSWLVRGAFIIGGYSIVLAVHFVAALYGATAIEQRAAIAGVPLSLMTAIYTGYLFAQAKARDLWQNPLLPPHLFVQAVLAGACVLSAFSIVFDLPSRDALLWLVSLAAVVQLLFVLAEFTLGHPTAHARMAAKEMTAGRYAMWFWLSIIAVAVAIFAPWIWWIAMVVALIGLFMYEHAYVQAGQSVPLA
jgi:formate-dependent nitrite reductase membrane component NrfD/ferredoxin